MHATLPPNFTANDMESLVDQKSGWTSASGLRDPNIKLIVVPTSLSASEWNAVSSATNAAGKKQHFGAFNGKSAPDLVIMDPEIASTSPQVLWCSSGLRAVDHCVETMCNTASHEEVNAIMEKALRLLLKGLKEYKEGKNMENREELLAGISESQWGSRDAMVGLLTWRIPMGPSHAIGHQLGKLFWSAMPANFELINISGSYGHVMHGVTSAIMLSPVLRYTKDRNPTAQNRVLTIFNDVLEWQEREAADAVMKFAQILGLPTRLSEVGITRDDQVAAIAEKTMTDAWGGQERQLEYEEILAILNMVR
jgi:alcohol dehydrogenase class IV